MNSDIFILGIENIKSFLKNFYHLLSHVLLLRDFDVHNSLSCFVLALLCFTFVYTRSPISQIGKSMLFLGVKCWLGCTSSTSRNLSLQITNEILTYKVERRELPFLVPNSYILLLISRYSTELIKLNCKDDSWLLNS